MKNLLFCACLGLLSMAIVFPTACIDKSTSPAVNQLANTRKSKTTPVYTYRIVNSYYHDPSAFTEGLVYDEEILYEGTGRYGQSDLRKVNLEGGDTLQMHKLPEQYFGEGITVFQDIVIQLTWKSNIGFVYDKDRLQPVQSFYYSTEGWGLTHDGTYLIMSDGTSRLYYLNPETFERVKHINVIDNESEVTWLNELEYINDEIYANLWQTEKIARIAPDTGEVVGWINLDGLLNVTNYEGKVDVLNGIAYDARNNRLFVTGKLWPRIFEIELGLLR